MKKLIFHLTFTLFSLLAFKSTAQNYHHGFGFQYNLASFSTYGSSFIVGVPSLTYKSTFGFEVGKVGIGISAYPSVGFFLSNSSDISYFGTEVPLMGELYLGDMDDKCFFTGLGFSAGYYTDFYDGGAILGPQIEIGGQFYIRESLVGMRAFFTKGVNGGTQHIYDGTTFKEKIFSTGLSFYYMLGQ